MFKRIMSVGLTVALLLTSMSSITVDAVTEEPQSETKLLQEVTEDVTGDVNADGVFDVSDVVLLQRWLLAVPNTVLANWKAANFCQDDRLDVFDLCLMKRTLIHQWQHEEESYDPPIKAVNPTLPSIGTNRIPVIAVSFPDYAFTEENISDLLQQNFFGLANPDDPQYPQESISAYYERASNGKMKLTGDVFTYTAEHPIDWYADDDARSLVTEIMTALDEQIDYQVYDSDKNKIIDAIAIVLPDETLEIDNDADEVPDWWAFTTSVTNKQKYDELEIGDFCLVVYDKSDCTGFIGKVAHELGHAMGLPDYYKYTKDNSFENDGLSGPAGNELMDEGRGDLSACSKLLLGWLSEDEVQVYSGDSQTFKITSMQYSPSCILIPRNTDDGYLSEYFLIEYITEEANNASASGNGIRILHVQAEVSEGKYGMGFKYDNHSQYYDTSNQKQRVLRLVNHYGYFYPGTRGLQYTTLIDGSIEGFHWYDEEGYVTIDTGLKIEICGHQPGPDYEPSDFDPSSSSDNENDPAYIKGSTYEIRISQAD